MGRIKGSSESGSEQLQNPKNPHRKTLPGPGVGMPGMQGLNEKAPFLPMGGGPGPRGTLEKTKKPTKPIPTRMGTKNHLSFEFQEEPSHKKEGKKAPMGTKGHLLCKFQGEPSLSKLVRPPPANSELRSHGGPRRGRSLLQNGARASVALLCSTNNQLSLSPLPKGPGTTG